MTSHASRSGSDLGLFEQLLFQVVIVDGDGMF
jgi:hypothetical protein